MIIGPLGDVGSGKTLWMADLGWKAYLRGYRIWANFKLSFPYEHLRYIEDLASVQLDKRNLYLLDEVWAWGADSRTPMDEKNLLLSKFILQARKKRADVVHSNQHPSQVDKRIRVNTQRFVFPSPLVQYVPSLNKFTFKEAKPDNGIVPYMLNIVFTDKFMQFLYENRCLVFGSEKLFDTHQQIETTRIIRYDVLKKKYWGFEGTKNDLAAVLHWEEGLKKAEASSFATYMMLKRTNEYLDELKDLKVVELKKSR